jgi:glucosamine--fructose-6-phosphate aminotransferase (isomerizing)
MIHVRDDGAARWDRDDGLTLDLVFGLPEALAPLATVIPGQLLAEAVARAHGHDPNAPIGLAKVTRTR